MKQKIINFYLNKTVFIVSSVIAVCFFIADGVQAMVFDQPHGYAWIFVALVVLLQWAFFKGHINVQKMLFGAVLFDMIIEQCSILKMDVEYGPIAIAMDIALLVIVVVVFVSHMYQQLDHKGKGGATFINQLLGLLAVVVLISAIINLISYPTYIGAYTFLFGYVFACIMIICMETRVAKYKQIRDAARAEGTWTEEKRKEAKKLFKL